MTAKQNAVLIAQSLLARDVLAIHHDPDAVLAALVNYPPDCVPDDVGEAWVIDFLAAATVATAID